MTTGTLYIVATPIGHLEDITLRALRVLKEVSVIACEDTRVTRKLLSTYGIGTPMVSHHAHSRHGEVERIVDRLRSGADVALVTDAGTPLVSDPGLALVAMVVQEGMRVVPIPGPSALLAAIMGSALPTAHFVFLGFLPRSSARAKEILAPLARSPYAIVIYESARRLTKTLEVLCLVLGDRPSCVARELTKRFESFVRGTLSELILTFKDAPKGEVVIIVGPPDAAFDQTRDQMAAAPERIRERLQELDAAPGRKAPVAMARELAKELGLSRKDAYRAVLEERDRRRASSDDEEE